MTISKRLRYEVMRRDDFSCRYCGRSSRETELQVDHVIPKTLGGADTIDNLVAACTDCNVGKGSTMPDPGTQQTISSGAQLWREAMAIAASEAENEIDKAQDAMVAVSQRWFAWKYPDGTMIERPKEWAGSVRVWFNRGLPVEVMVQSVDIAMEATHVAAEDKWRYFCGIAWNKVNKLEQRAKELLEEAGHGGSKEESLREAVEDEEAG